MKKIIIPTLCLIYLAFLASCKQNTPKTAGNTENTAETATVLAENPPVSAFDTMAIEARLNAENKFFDFKATRS